ncbi:CmcI family methyltransferase [Pedobacter agri]|uniref:CmcI family methyltransferase n=1 Tax=Pedobacter agri TaxID=454586 RepID=UPI0029304BAC|nr:CmcI family methyltransferase [Pedobacter agri]
MRNIFKKKNNYTDEVSFDIKSIEQGHHKLQYKNVPMIKCPFDYLIYQMLIFRVKPDLIIEIGTNQGGSSLYLADLLELSGKGQLHTIDIVDVRHDDAKSHPRIKFFADGFQNYDTKLINGYNTVLIIEDGSHTYDDVKATLDKFEKFVSKDSYFIIEDGILDKLGWKQIYNGGPNRAIKEFLEYNKSYIIDRQWCDLFGTNATFNTNGFLKKID